MSNSDDIKQKFMKFYESSTDVSDVIVKLDDQLTIDIDRIISRIASNKAVYTVLITLAFYKSLHPEQDIRNARTELPNGFSGRSFDTKYITPTLKELKLPAMAESGWLTRSLELPQAFDMNFGGKITPNDLKQSFLRTVAYIQDGKNSAEDALRVLLNGGVRFRENNNIEIKRISSNDIEIAKIIVMLEEHFNKQYNTHGASKLPVLAFYAIYSMLVSEMKRYSGANLLQLGSHTASDRSSKSAGDIQVARDSVVFEAVEVKLDKPITAHMVRVAYEKINKFGVSRYYILSGVESDPVEVYEINQMIVKIKREHGCQVMTNGLYQTFKLLFKASF